MQIFIAGATGVLGRRLVQEFTARGHTVIGLARDERGARIVESAGGVGRVADLFDADALARIAGGSDTVIHAATAIPKKHRLRAGHWTLNDRIRRDGTLALTRCASFIGAETYLQQSVAWVNRPPGGEFFDEGSPPQPDEVTRSAWDGENIAREAGDAYGFTVSVLRCGSLYAADAWHTRMLGVGLRTRTIPLLDDGAASWSCLHADDAATAFVAAVEQPRAGVWHVVDNEPVRVRDFLGYFADRLGSARPRNAPTWLVRLLAGQGTVKFFASSTITSNRRFRAEFGWAPRYPTYREGIDQIVAEWQSSAVSERAP